MGSLAFDLAAAVNILIGGLVAVLGGLVAAWIQASATERAGRLAIEGQRQIARDADRRERRRAQTDPVMAYARRVARIFGDINGAAQQGNIDAVERWKRRVDAEIEEFDSLSIYLVEGEEFSRMAHGFLESVREAQTAVASCLTDEGAGERLTALSARMLGLTMQLAVMLTNLSRAANLYVYEDEPDPPLPLPFQHGPPPATQQPRHRRWWIFG